jgi:hypothetical protein
MAMSQQPYPSYPAGGPPPGPPSAVRSRKPLWITLGILGAVVLALCCGGMVFAIFATDKQPESAPRPLVGTSAPSPASSDTTSPPAAASTPTTTPPLKPSGPEAAPGASYTPLSPRQWAALVKNPDAHAGERIVVYGVVTQFDGQTGTDAFRADVGAQNMQEAYQYETNTIMSGDEESLADVVEGDEFRADVTVIGAYTYETTAGAQLTVPLLMVDSIRVL